MGREEIEQLFATKPKVHEAIKEKGKRKEYKRRTGETNGQACDASRPQDRPPFPFIITIIIIFFVPQWQTRPLLARMHARSHLRDASVRAARAGAAQPTTDTRTAQSSSAAAPGRTAGGARRLGVVRLFCGGPRGQIWPSGHDVRRQKTSQTAQES